MYKSVFIGVSLFMLFIYGCFPPYQSQYHATYSDSIDFTKYSDNGFLFTTLDYTGDYESCGLIKIILYPDVYVYTSQDISKELVYEKKKIKKTSAALWTDELGKYYQDDWLNNQLVEIIYSTELVDSAYSQALRWNANAIISLKLLKGPINGPDTLKGFAIRRITK
jgi:hypothetical protein